MGEEDFLITKLVSTPYVEATEEELECSFRSFEIAHATMMEATVDEVIKPHMFKVEVMTTRIMRGGGYYLNQNLETLLPSNDERLGLGYKPSIYDKIRLQEEKKKRRLAKLEMREFDPNGLLTKMESLSIVVVAQEASFEGNCNDPTFRTKLSGSDKENRTRPYGLHASFLPLVGLPLAVPLPEKLKKRKG
ncbi:Gag-pro-like protein [Cucumis melo var. makuwa]|nr:Gag-pro-like protein [Cucumis melo var. makuwa]